MAYPSICPPCREGKHNKCLRSWDKPPPRPDGALVLGGAFCVCAHGGPESTFQRNVRERLEESGHKEPVHQGGHDMLNETSTPPDGGDEGTGTGDGGDSGGGGGDEGGGSTSS